MQSECIVPFVTCVMIFLLQKQNRNEVEQLQVVQPLSETGSTEMPLAAAWGL